MQEFSGSSSSSSQAPLLSPVSSSSDGEYDGDARSTYGSTSGKNDAIVPINSHTDDDDDEDDGDEELDVPAHGGIQQADAINQVWTKAALVTAYLLYADEFYYTVRLMVDHVAVSFYVLSPTLYSGRSSSTLCHML